MHAARLIVASLMLVGTCGLSACAPEPVVITGNGGKDQTTTHSESNWGSPTTSFDAEKPNTQIPASFPGDRFIVPPQVTVLNVGERGAGVWFIVFDAASESSALSLWETIITSNGFSVAEDEQALPGEKQATLTGPTLQVHASMLPAEGGRYQLSYDLTSTV